ncbi:hypothetical protein BZA77DRAFT_363082 [Pyronema omphalodes]|nr:hypothetical protein BZA77DRAFT_363082 [Pyronema omphalodes]
MYTARTYFHLEPLLCWELTSSSPFLPFSIVPTQSLLLLQQHQCPTDKATAIAAANTAAASEAMQKGNIFYSTGKFDEARRLPPPASELLEAALQYECEDGKRATLMVRRAKCQFFLGDFQEAKVALREAIDGGAEGQEGFLKAVYYHLTLPRKNKKVGVRGCGKYSRDSDRICEVSSTAGEFHDADVQDPSFVGISCMVLIMPLRPITDEDILAKSTESFEPVLNLSFFYGADGDARSFYQQLHHLDCYKPTSTDLRTTTFKGQQ